MSSMSSQKGTFRQKYMQPSLIWNVGAQKTSPPRKGSGPWEQYSPEADSGVSRLRDSFTSMSSQRAFAFRGSTSSYDRSSTDALLEELEAEIEMSEAGAVEDVQVVAPLEYGAAVASNPDVPTNLDDPTQGTAVVNDLAPLQPPAANVQDGKAECQEPDSQLAPSKDSCDDGTHALLMSALMDMKSEYAKLAGLFSQNMQQLSKSTRWACAPLSSSSLSGKRWDPARACSCCLQQPQLMMACTADKLRRRRRQSSVPIAWQRDGLTCHKRSEPYCCTPAHNACRRQIDVSRLYMRMLPRQGDAYNAQAINPAMVGHLGTCAADAPHDPQGAAEPARTQSVPAAAAVAMPQSTAKDAQPCTTAEAPARDSTDRSQRTLELKACALLPPHCSYQWHPGHAPNSQTRLLVGLQIRASEPRYFWA